jgi:hypothetical protein
MLLDASGRPLRREIGFAGRIVPDRPPRDRNIHVEAIGFPLRSARVENPGQEILIVPDSRRAQKEDSF